MSRGLSKLQNKIIETLKTDTARDRKEWLDIGSLAYMVFDKKYGVDCFNVSGYHTEPPSESEMQSFWRSIRLLEKRGVLQARKTKVKGRICSRGGNHFTKEVKCLVLFVLPNWSKHLESDRSVV